MPFRPSQADFKGRGDTVGLNVDTFDYGAHVNFTRARDTAFRLRFLLQEVGGVSDSGTAYKLRASLSGGTYQDVTSSSTIAKLMLSGQYADKDATSSNLLGGSGSYVNGQGLESSTSTDSLTLTASNKMELEFCVQINSADVALNQYVEFRLYRGTSTVMYSYTYTPRVYPLQTITGAGALASAEAFGSATVSAGGSTQNITGAGAVASIVAFGTAKLSLRVVPSGLASVEAFGTAKLNLKITLTGIASTEVFGSLTISSGAQAISGAGAVASLQALGSPRKADLLYPGGQLQSVLHVPYVKRVAPSRRYLEMADGRPFFVRGDSPKTLVLLSLADMETFVSSRSAAGLNALWVNVLGKHTIGVTTYDGLTPFTTTDDLSTPRESYFARVDDMLDLLARYGMTAFLNPIETDTWLTVAQSNGNTKMYNYGAYLGNRYKDFTNIVWQHGNDFQTWDTSSDRDLYVNTLDGIRSADTNHIHTFELNYDSSDTLQDSTYNTRCALNSAYAYFPQYDRAKTAYNRTVSGNPVPAFFVEGVYEFQSWEGGYTGAHELRAQEYWTLLSGMCGHLYGHNPLYIISTGFDTGGWDTTTGFLHTVKCNNFFKGISWWELVPDFNHTVLTAGYGTYDTTGLGNTSDYCTCARISDGSLVLAYMPVAQTLTMDMTKLRGTVTCRWFDPTDASYATDAASPHTNTGTHDFSRAGANAAGDHDWLLVLTA